MTKGEEQKPGIINDKQYIKKIMVTELFLKMEDEEQYHLNTSAKEGEHFIIVNEKIWEYLQSRYDGIEIKRFSIELPNDTDKREFAIEVFLKRILFYILPKKSRFVTLKRPAPIYISRLATIGELREYLGSILAKELDDWSIEDMLRITRFWKLDLGENINEIEY